MKQSYIGTYRRADNLNHWDRSYQRGAGKDFIARVNEGMVDDIIPEVSEDVRMQITALIYSIERDKLRMPAVSIAEKTVVRIRECINLK